MSKHSYQTTNPRNVSNYHAVHPEFPHETTTDQWFSESQLESYRMLGVHTIEKLCTSFTPQKPYGFRDFLRDVQRHLEKEKLKAPDWLAPLLEKTTTS